MVFSQQNFQNLFVSFNESQLFHFGGPMKVITKKTSALIMTLATLATFSTVSCTSPGKKTAVGAGAGAAAGALVGAVIGHQTGNRGKGALIGAGVGALLGGAVGNRLDKQAKELEAIAETKRTEQGIVSKLKSDILFDTGKSELKSQAVMNIGKMAEILKKYPENVLTIRGYTDNTGSAKVNEELSQRRAAAVQTQLIAGGVPASTISVVGMGPQNPIADNKSAAGRAQNRRVEIEITVDESKVPQDQASNN
jgi:outer membrane protein OmpA-like peptidoglycan-associated protein